MQQDRMSRESRPETTQEVGSLFSAYTIITNEQSMQPMRIAIVSKLDRVRVYARRVSGLRHRIKNGTRGVGRRNAQSGEPRPLGQGIYRRRKLLQPKSAAN